MPELPEVETVRRGLEPVMKGRRIVKAVLHRTGLRTPFAPDLAATLENRRVDKVSRRAKYLLFHLDSGDVFVLHLGMSGRVSVLDNVLAYARHKHDHIILTLDDGKGIGFNDARRFGMAFTVPCEQIESHHAFKSLGPEPLSASFTGEVLKAGLRNKKTAIKTALLDQRVVAGIGNIYASEALYEAKIAPDRSSHLVTGNETNILVEALQTVLKKAIAAGGSSLRDHRQADGNMGYFQHQFTVYGQNGKPCPRRKANDRKKHIVQKITQGGRSTFYCPDCQKV